MKEKNNDLAFLKKINGISNECIIKKNKLKNDTFVNSINVSDGSHGYVVHSVQKWNVFDGEDFGIKNIKSFIKFYEDYDSMGENENEIIFTSPKTKIVFKKHEKDVMVDIPSLGFEKDEYTEVKLSLDDVVAFKEAIKNNFSDFAYLMIKDKKLVLKIGQKKYDNIYEEEIKELETEVELKSCFKLEHLKQLFNSLDTMLDNNIYLYLNNDDKLVCREINNVTSTIFYIINMPNED